MRSIKFVCSCLSVLALCGVARAATFDFSNMILTENKGGTKIYGTVVGSVTIDTTTGDVTSGNFYATDGASSPSGVASGDPGVTTYDFDSISTATKVTGGSPSYDLTVFEDTTDSVFFDLEYTDVSGVIDLCTSSADGGNGACDQAGGPTEQSHLATSPNEDLTNGSLVPATPEPSSLTLLGTGLLAITGMARRRFFLANR